MQRTSQIENLQKSMVVIYLAGKVPKNNESFDDRFHWTTNHMDELRRCLSPFDANLLNPAFNDSDLSQQQHVFGRDMHYVLSSDVVFVDARDKKGLGVGAEMMLAKMNGIPVVSWAPQGTHYNQPHFLHPFVEALSDVIVETLQDGAEWIELHLRKPMEIKGPDSIYKAVQNYKNTYPLL